MKEILIIFIVLIGLNSWGTDFKCHIKVKSLEFSEILRLDANQAHDGFFWTKESVLRFQKDTSPSMIHVSPDLFKQTMVSVSAHYLNPLKGGGYDLWLVVDILESGESSPPVVNTLGSMKDGLALVNDSLDLKLNCFPVAASVGGEGS